MQSITLINGSKSFSWYDNAEGTTLQKFEGFEYAEPIVVVDNLAGKPGAHYITSKFGKRIIAWQGDLVGGDVFARRRELLSAMAQGNLKTLKFTTYDGLALQVEGEISKVLNPYTHTIHTFLVEMTIPDYRLYSQAIHTVSTPPTNSTGGSPLPTALPMSFASPSGAANLIVSNAGDAPTSPIIKINGSGQNFTLQNTTTGQILQLSMLLASSNDVVEIDIAKKTAILNGVTNVYGLVSGDWFDLIPGNNSIYFNLAALATSLTKVTIEYRDAYMGI